MTKSISHSAPTPSIREALKHALASLVAAISLLERTPRAKKAAPSDKMFDQMIADYKAAIEQGRAALAALPQDVGEGIARNIEPEAVTPNGRFMPRMLVIDADHVVCVGGRWDGWKFYRHPDGQWVSLEKLKEESLAPSSPAST